jgi:DNA helicase-2/ATP-dependent DNA helicase PcrA
VPSTFLSPQTSFSNFRANPYPRGGYRGNRVREEPAYSYADEDQSVPNGLRPGIRVKHPQFGVGTVLSVEQLDDDVKLLVRFQTVGQKTLRAKYAKLEMVS